MINDLEFEEAKALLPQATAAAKSIPALGKAAREAGVPVVYVNDNYGQWHSERSLIVEHCSREGALARDVVKSLEPEEEDYFVMKPQFSGFYSTNLPAPLPRPGAQRLILTGVSADICVPFTAADAHMREYDLWVPADCVASFDPRRTRWALEIMRNSMKAKVSDSRELTLIEWLALDSRGEPQADSSQASR